MKNYYVILIAFFLVSHVSVSQYCKCDTKYQIEIYIGVTEYGTKSIMLNHEGLLIREDSYTMKPKRKTFFINRYELDYVVYKEICLLLEAADGFRNIEEKLQSDEIAFYRPNRIIIREINGPYFKQILDYNYMQGYRGIGEEQIQEMYDLIYILMPKKYRFKQRPSAGNVEEPNE